MMSKLCKLEKKYSLEKKHNVTKELKCPQPYVKNQTF